MPNTCAARFSGNSSIKEPAIAARNKKPIRYPPVGPKSVPRPPENPPKTGIPTAPKSKYSPQAAVPCLAPSTYAIKQITRLVRLMGTGLMGTGIENGPSTQAAAVISAIAVIFAVLFRSPFAVIKSIRFLLICRVPSFF